MVLPFEISANVAIDHRTDYGIGIVGMGGIVQYAHLPAYRKAGFHVVACTDLDYEKAQAVAAAYGIANVYPTVEAMLEDRAVEIVDIAVMPWAQRDVVAKVAAAGKHMLCQKPLAQDLATAYETVALAAVAGVKQAINQQMRWDAGIRLCRNLIAQGVIGQPTDAQIQVNVSTQWQMWPWLAAVDKLEIMFHSIHYLDALRFLLGDPEWITSRHARYPNQGDVRGETKTVTILDYANGLQGLVSVNHYNEWAEPFATFRIVGTQGALDGTIGLMYNYPSGRPDTLQITSHLLGSGNTVMPTLTEKWIPDAFSGPMAALMQAVDTNSEPRDNSTRDNLNTLLVVHAAYRSAAENRSVHFEEMS